MSPSMSDKQTLYSILYIWEHIELVIYSFLLFLYFTVVFTIAKNKKSEFKNSFFTFVIVLGCFDMYRGAGYMFFMIIPRHWFHSFFWKYNHELAIFGGQTVNFCMQVTRAFNIVIALNRMTAIAWPMSYQSIWRPERQVKVIMSALVFAVITNIHYFVVYWNGAHWVKAPLGNNRTALMGTYARDFTPIQITIASTGNVVLSVLTMITYIITYGIAFGAAFKASRRVEALEESNQDSQMRKTELNLTMAMAVLALIQMAWCINNILIFWCYACMVEDRYLYYVRLDVMLEADALLNPVLLLIMSSKVRDEFFKLWLCKSQVQKPMASGTSGSRRAKNAGTNHK